MQMSVPPPGIEPAPLAVKAQSPIHWAAMEFPGYLLSWLWWWFHGRIHASNHIQLYTLNICSLWYVSYTSIALNKQIHNTISKQFKRHKQHLITWTTALSNSMKLNHAVEGHPRWLGRGGEFWQTMVHWGREWQTTSVFLPWEPHEQYEKPKIQNTERWTPQVSRCPIYYWRSLEK